MIKNAVSVILVCSFTSCSGGNGLHSEGSIGSAQIPPISSNDAPGKVEASTHAETAPVSSSDERVSPPAVVTGSYLNCIRIEGASLPKSEASLGCNIINDGEKKALTPDTKLEWGYLEVQDLAIVFTESSANSEFLVKIHIKATSEQDLLAQLPALRITVLADGQALDPAKVAFEICGGAGNFCYDDAAAISAAVATTPSGKSIEYVISSGSNYVWKEVSGNRILKADGSDNWAKKLNADGRGFSATDFTSYASIVGRKCPPNVYIDDSNKFMTGNCLYYTSEAVQTLFANGKDGINGMSSWSTAKWYEGNIQVCATKGMRLPTVFETATTDTTGSGYYPTADGSPTFAQGSGIPSNGGYTWTASAYTGSTSYYWGWLGTAVSGYVYTASHAAICVLP